MIYYEAYIPAVRGALLAVVDLPGRVPLHYVDGATFQELFWAHGREWWTLPYESPLAALTATRVGAWYAQEVRCGRH